MSDETVTATGETETETGAGSKPVVRIPCEVFSRIVGYLRPVKAWNVGKRQEFEERVDYKLPAQT